MADVLLDYAPINHAQGESIAESLGTIAASIGGTAQRVVEAANSATAAAASASNAATSASNAATSASAANTSKNNAATSATNAANSATAAAGSATAAASSAASAAEAAAEVLSSQIVTDASGSIASFSDGADDVPVKSLVAEITPVQSGSGDPSPDNIRPISGRTGLTVTRAGKNLMPNMAGTTTNTTNGITYTYNDDGSFTINGTATANAYSKAVAGVTTNIYLPHGTYKKPTAQNGNVGVYVQYIRSASNWTTVTGGGTVSQTFVIDEDYPLAIRMAVFGGTTVDNLHFEPYIYPESVSDLTWVSPVKNAYPVSWQTEAGTVYGGTLDVVSGVLTVDRGFAELSEDWAWRKSSAYPGGYIVNRDVVPGTAKLSTPFVCSHAKTVTRTADYVFGTCYCDSSMNFRIMGESSTLQDWKDYIAAQRTAGTPVQICYYLAAPQTYQLTPTEVRTLLGVNNLWSDAGDVSVEYIADTKMYIDKRIAELQALVLEN